MRQYVTRRLLLIPILLLGITALDFGFINLAPGDPVTAMINPNELRGLTKQAVEARRRALGLDRPIYVRYAIWLKELARGNLGYSIVKAQPVAQMMKVGIKNTITLMAMSMVVTSIVGVTLG